MGCRSQHGPFWPRWRRGWDSNPREAFDLYSLSRGAPSTTRPPLRWLPDKEKPADNQQRILPETAREDALHIAIAITGGMNYLLTWNCRHIANAEIQQAIANICHQTGYNMPILCTPELLMGG